MTLKYYNPEPFLTEAGFKQAISTTIWVHETKDITFHLKKISSRLYQFVRIPVVVPDKKKNQYARLFNEGKDYALHKLKALAFHDLGELKKKLPENFTYWDLSRFKIVVNHKDGNKVNNHKDNIEWCTYSDNIEHAYQTGLRTDNHGGFYFDVITGEENAFYSLSDLARKIGIHSRFTSTYIRSKRDALLAHRYMVRRQDEEDYPHPLTKDDIWRHGVYGIDPVIATNLETGEVTYHPNGKAARIACYGKKGAGFKFESHEDVVYRNGFKFSPLNDYDMIMKVMIEYQESKEKRAPRDHGAKRNRPKIQVIHPDGMIGCYENIDEAARAFGMKVDSLRARILKYKGHWKDYQFSYVSPI